MGTLPLLKGKSIAKGQLLLSSSSARGADAEHFRRLSSMFLHTYCSGNGNGSDVKSVAVTSAVVGEGKTTIAVNLAVALAKTGKNVLLIDGDLRRPALHRFFHLKSKPGLADVLANGVMLDEAILTTSIPVLDLLPAGDLQHHPVELVELGGFEKMLQELSSRYDIVVLDCCPVMGPSETLQMAKATDGVLFVVRAGRVNSDLLVNVRYELERIGANTLGMILNRQRMSRSESHYYNAYYGAQK